jgi:hypothetical protein
MPPINTSSLTQTEIQTIRSGIEQCIVILDQSKGEKRERELALRAKLVELHAEVERLDLDSSPPFTRSGQ